MANNIGKYRYLILSLLFFATTINYIDRQIIGILKPAIAADLGWSEFDYGLIVSAFQIAYAIGLLISGAVIDKFGTRIGYAIAIGIWSFAGILHAAARSTVSFAAFRFLLGLGESANFPSAIKAVAEWFPKKERAYATGWFNSGATIGAIVAPLIVTGIALGMGWRWAFIITGVLGFVWIAIWLSFFYTPARHPKLSKEEFDFIHQDVTIHDESVNTTWINLFKFSQTYALCATRFISDWVWWFFLFWTPDFLNKAHGINLKDAVLPLVVIYTAASFGGIGGGWFSSTLIKNGKSIIKARKSAIFLSALLVLPVMFVPQIKSLWGAVTFIAIACASHQAWAANMFTIISDIFPKGVVGSVTGLTGFCGAIGGALSASFIGIILDTTGSYFAIFAIASIVYFLNWLIIKSFIPSYQLTNVKTPEQRIRN